MPKGKKFDAAEKHFEKKRVEYQKIIEDLHKQLENEIKTNADLRNRCVELEAESRRLDDKVQCMLQLTNMSEQQIEYIIEHDKKMSEAFDVIIAMGKFRY